MLRGADLLPSTFNTSELTEERVTEMLTTGIALLTMILEGDPNSDDATARTIYREFFSSTPPN